MMTKPAEMAVVRTKLRAVNLEYSALVRENATKDRFGRLDELRAERRALMAIMANERERAARPPHISARQQVFNSPVQEAAQ